MRRVDQILPTLSYGDAVSNDTIALQKVLRDLGFNSNIYAENIGPKVSKLAKKVEQYKEGKKTDVLIYHMSTGTNLSHIVKEYTNVKKIMIYHNITPGEYFRNYDKTAYKLVQSGRLQLSMLKNSFALSLADSEFNEKELVEYGYSNTATLPILIPFEDYNKEPDKAVIKKYKDGRTNILFVGRIAPNKKQEDVIKSFYYYKKYIDKDSRLFLVGSYYGMEKYYEGLKKLVETLELEDVYFTGHTSFNEILAYYKIADIFLCMSEHEGFCVPLIESMIFEVPIVAYDSTAIGYTLGNSGILIKDKDYKLIAELLHHLKENKELKEKIIKNQKERLEDFSNEKVIELFKSYLNKVIGD